MRKSLLSRSLIGVAGLAVASVTLAAVPASAATAGVTRAEVLAAAAAVRADGADTMGLKFASTNRTLRTLANKVCAIDHSAEAVVLPIALATQAGDDADGLMVGAAVVDLSIITTLFGGEVPTSEDEMLALLDNALRVCLFGAVAATDTSSSLSGTMSIELLGASSHSLSGDVFVSPARNLRASALVSIFEGETPPAMPSFSVTGNATKVTATKVSTPKTTKQKKAAKKAKSKALKSAKNSYTKALKKAGDSKKKKSAAKKAYSKKKAAANAKYKSAIATFKIVNRSSANPFSISAVLPAIEFPGELPE